jgi:sarcosine oxidase
MRIVVVGAGVIGMLTAVECVRAGAQVDLVDQAGIPSASAASYDLHRVVRTLHRGDVPLTVAAAGLPEAWADVERMLGARFFHRTGVLTATSEDDLGTNLALLAEAGVKGTALSPAELAARCPHVQFPADRAGVLEPTAGTVQADQALLAIAAWLRGQPTARLHQHREVVRVEDNGIVRFADGSELAGDSVVVAAGAWSRDLLPAALTDGLTLKRQTMLSYAPNHSAWADSPAVLGLGTGGDAWVMPPVGGTPVRVSAGSACRTVPEMTDRDTPSRWRDHLADRFAGLLTGFDPAAIIGTTEGYYLTDESGEGPLLAELGDGAVWAYAACGGMSFKFAPLVSKALASRAMGRLPRWTGLDSVDRPRQLAVHREEARRFP